MLDLVNKAEQLGADLTDTAFAIHETPFMTDADFHRLVINKLKDDWRSFVPLIIIHV